MYVVIEGPNGVGKTTTINALTAKLKNMQLKTSTEREPGGTKIGEELRAILKTKININLSWETEFLLMMASRSQLFHEKINDLPKDTIMITDRSVVSSAVYQFIRNGLPLTTLKQVYTAFDSFPIPDFTFILYNANKNLAKQINMRTPEIDRFEHKQYAINEADAYLSLLNQTISDDYGDVFGKIIKINASQTTDTITDNILEHIRQQLQK